MSVEASRLEERDARKILFSQDGEPGTTGDRHDIFAIRKKEATTRREYDEVRTRFSAAFGDSDVQSSSCDAAAVVLHVSLHRRSNNECLR